MVPGDRKTLVSWLPDVLLLIGFPILAYFSVREVLKRLDPDAGAKAEAQQKALAASNRLQSIFSNHDRDDDDDDEPRDQDEYGDDDAAYREDRREPLVLTPMEQTIAMEVVTPNEIPVTFQDIGGLDGIIEELRESVIYPLTMPHLYSSHSSLLTAPSGVLLYGPPGCGKTMLAKALARESGARFINLHISTLTEKWYGDSNKLVAAVFSLARKLQPTIVFIDEIDAVLGQRRSGEHEASGMVKAEFMTHWDGLASSTREGGSQRICILGATNRIQDIDEAILRRMPKKFPVGLPNAGQRRSIFELTLRETKVDRGVGQGGRKKAFDVDMLVKLSAGMSGSDIKEACRDAAMVPVREYIKMQSREGRSMRGIRSENVRGLQTEDFFGMRGSVGVGNGLQRRRTGEVEDEDKMLGTGSGSSKGQQEEEEDEWRDVEDPDEVDVEDVRR
ncbi:mitochondrial dynamin GTPase Msp1 [Recurvomyces mirabilis]|uniref:Mitochondrial dynamin GTPase Msp1 n=1 Tax=Recurvomyces mirabilis TaxID=574656 RepID=A0AAE1C542_9PEZI|nr:mitochondrial dynamin GTPase Msp1 [Recurvomyces mirabilis]KAK5151784.1 mitochondrial dynamin GTPase Msp1 [Recurvomyces mirabilis]